MRIIALIASCFFYPVIIAQTGTADAWSLQKCIDYAVANNLDVRQAEILSEQAKINFDQSRMNLLPDLNGNAGQYFQSGRNIDRFTNTAVQSTVSNENFSLSTGVTLFAGGQLRNNIQSNKLNWMASEEDKRYAELNISLNVANLFLQIAQARELVKSAEQNKENTVSQLTRATKQFEAGVINEGAVLSLKAQQANDDASIINAKNQEKNALISLKLLLRVAIDQNFDVEIPHLGTIEPKPYTITLAELYDSALARRPDIKAADLRIASSEFRKKTAVGGLYPMLTLGANVNTVYSSSAKEITGVALSDPFIIGRVANTNENVVSQQPVYTLATTSFNQQLKNNFGQSVGLNLSVPIFGKLQSQNNIKLAKLDIERSKINAERARQNLYNEIVGVYSAFESATSRYQAAQLSSDAQGLNLNFVQKRFDGGQSSAFELQIAKSTENVARVNALSLKYEYIFRKLVLDFYMGKKLEINE